MSDSEWTHDFGLKTSFSYGESRPAAVAEVMKSRGLHVIGFSDLFSIDQNDQLGLIEGVDVVTASEWHCKCEWEGVERVDLVFVGFEMTSELRTWVMLERRRIAFKEELMSKVVDFSGSYLYPIRFGEIIKERNLRRTYFGTLPDIEQTLSHFKDAGATVILSGIPFSTELLYRWRIVKRLVDSWGMKALVVFKNEDRYIDPELEIEDSLKLCQSAGLMPVVCSGLYKNYGNRVVAMEMAKGAFDFLTRAICEEVTSCDDHG